MMTPYHTAPNVTLYNAPALDVARSLSDDSVDLIVCDFPYFRVKSDDWDNQWKTAADFLAWMAEHLVEFQRILAPNGSYYGFASPQMAARVEVLTGEYFNVLNSIRWVKDAGWHKKADEEGLRAYLRPWEAVIFAEQNFDQYADNSKALHKEVHAPLGRYIQMERERAGFKGTDVDIALGYVRKKDPTRGTELCRRWEEGSSLPTKEAYERLRGFLNRNQPNEYLRREYEELRREYEELRREYEELRREYEELRRPFNAHKDAPYTDVWTFPTVAPHKGKHPCEKPETMLKHIIEISSKPGGVVFDPMCGSGGSAYAARNLGRVWIGGDTDARWCDATVKRLARDFDDWQPKAREGAPVELLRGLK